MMKSGNPPFFFAFQLKGDGAPMKDANGTKSPSKKNGSGVAGGRPATAANRKSQGGINGSGPSGGGGKDPVSDSVKDRKGAGSILSIGTMLKSPAD